MKRRTRLNREAGTPGKSSSRVVNAPLSLPDQLYAELQKTRLPNSYATDEEVVSLAARLGPKAAVAYLQIFGKSWL